MQYRFLKTRTTEPNIVISSTVQYAYLSTAARYYIFINNLDKPICLICSTNITKFKGSFSKTCSRTCAKELTLRTKNLRTKQVRCELCNENHNSMSCTKQLPNIKKSFYPNNWKDYIIQLRTNFKQYNYSKRAILLSAGYSDKKLPICKVCSERHTKTNHNMVSCTCSTKCSNLYKIKHATSAEVIERTKHLFNSESLTIFQKYKIYNSSGTDKHCALCNNVFFSQGTKYCSTKCAALRTYKHNSELNASTFKSYIKDSYFLIEEVMRYFNLSYSTALRLKHKFNIIEPQKKKYGLIEQKVYTELGISALRNDRIVLNGKELDIYYKNHNIAIEYNGLIWHSYGTNKHAMFNKQENFNHLYKTNACENKSIQLFHIFENEYLDNPDCWISIIKRSLKLYKISTCNRIREVSFIEAKEFYNSNSLYSISDTDICIGAYKDTELVQCLAFNKNRLISSGTLVNVQANEYSTIISYYEELYSSTIEYIEVDRRWETGQQYKELGFKFLYCTKPRNYYVLGTKIVQFKTDRIINDSGTKVLIKYK